MRLNSILPNLSARSVRQSLSVLTIAASLIVPSTVRADETPIQLTDDRGKTIELAKPARRPAAISTFGADVAQALGVTPVAVTSFGLEGPPEYLGPAMAQVPSLGPRHQPNLERLSAIAPDLVFAIRRYTEKDGPQIETIAPMLALDLITLRDSLNAVALAGSALGKPEEGERLNIAFMSRLESLAGRNPAPRTAAVLTAGGETPFIYHDHFLAAELLERLNVDNVGGASPNARSGVPLGYRISLEALLELNPDIIFLMPSNRQRGYTVNPIWPYLQAVRNKQVYEVSEHWKENAGPTARSLVLDDIERLLLMQDNQASADEQ